MPGPSVAASARTVCFLRALPAFAAHPPSTQGRRAGQITGAASRRASSSTRAMAAADASDGAAVAAAPPLPAPPTLWQRVTERYDAAQRDAAATMTDTNTGEQLREAGLRQALRGRFDRSSAGACSRAGQACCRRLTCVHSMSITPCSCRAGAGWWPSVCAACGGQAAGQAQAAARRERCVWLRGCSQLFC